MDTDRIGPFSPEIYRLNNGSREGDEKTMKTTHLTILPTGDYRLEINRFARFLAVGVSGTLVDFLVLSALKLLFGWATLPANLVSYSCGIVNNYLLSRSWVYPESGKQRSFTRLLQFALVSLIGLGLNNLLVLVVETPAGHFLPNPDYGYIPAKIIASFVVLLWNFFANRFWTFGQGKVTPVKIELKRQGAEPCKQKVA